MIDIRALKAGQEAVAALQDEIKRRIVQEVPTAQEPSVYFMLMGHDYDIEVRTSSELNREQQDTIDDIIDAVRAESGIYPGNPGLEGGLGIHYTVD